MEKLTKSNKSYSGLGRFIQSQTRYCSVIKIDSYYTDGLKKGILINSGDIEKDIETAIESIKTAKKAHIKNKEKRYKPQ
jgi:hypothetical protein